MIEHVSVSAYEDGDLLDACIESIRGCLGDVAIQVVDGKYDTFRPDAPANSTDATRAVAEDWGATYIAGGPYSKEQAKHVDRVERAPDGTRTLFMDADERLVTAQPQGFDGAALLPRIYNAKVYSDGPVVRWPRSFDPASVRAINKWDAYLFDAPVERTDTITIAHRHDLRGRDYREAKYDRIKAEGRTVRYDGNEERYYAGEFDVDTAECPRCGMDTLVHSPPTDADGDGLTRVAVCLAGDSCYRAIERMTVDEYRYLPDNWEAGFADPERLQAELVAAGCDWAERADLSDGALKAKVGHWVMREMEAKEE